MSNEEQRVQHETISAIDMKVSDIVKIIKIWVPILAVICTVIGGFITLIVTGYEFEKSLVKKPQFEKAMVMLVRQDSSLNAKIDTVNKNKIGFKDLTIQATNRKGANRSGLKGVTATKDEYGNITYTPIY